MRINDYELTFEPEGMGNSNSSEFNEMKVPFSLEVDLSKKGTVYETDFQAPWNMWGTEVMFNLIICLSSKESIPSFIHNGQQSINFNNGPRDALYDNHCFITRQPFTLLLSACISGIPSLRNIRAGLSSL